MPKGAGRCCSNSPNGLIGPPKQWTTRAPLHGETRIASPFSPVFHPAITGTGNVAVSTNKYPYRRNTMITLDTLKKRNHDFAAHRFTASMSLFPASKPIIISCVDPRADPAHILGLEFGDPAKGTSSLFITPTAGSPALQGNPTCWPATLKLTKRNCRPKRSPIPGLRLPSMSLRSRRTRCRARGLFLGWSMT